MITRLSPKIMQIMKEGSREERLYICERELIYFAIYYFSEFFTFSIPYFQFQMYDDCKRLIAGELKESAWIMFRESAKTSIAKLFTTWCICYRKKEYVNYDSYDKGNAEAALFDIAVWLQTNERLIADFGQLYFTYGD